MNTNRNLVRDPTPNHALLRSSAHRADWSRAMLLTDAEFLACWWELGLGDPPLDLELEPSRLPGRTPAQRRGELDRTITGVRRSGVLDEYSGRRSPLAHMLRLLSRPGHSVDLRIGDRTGSMVALGVVGAAQPSEAVVVVRRERQLSVLSTRPARMSTTLVELVGPLSPGRARPVNIPAELGDQARATAAGQGPWALADDLVALGVARNDANSLARMCSGITVAGQFGATGYAGGTEHRAPWVVGFHRAADGDFLQLRRAEILGGSETLTVAPINADRLLGHLNAVIAAVPNVGSVA